MGLNFALDELQATGWSDLDSTGCNYDTDGRAFPSVERVRQEFLNAGFDLRIERVEAFKCYRALWQCAGSDDDGTVVGHTESEAAVFALAQLRRRLLVEAI